MSDWTCKQVILDLLIEYEDGAMESGERVLFERHIEMCPPCVNFLTTYRATGRTIGQHHRSGRGRLEGSEWRVFVLDPGQDADHQLRPGLSVAPTVSTK